MSDGDIRQVLAGKKALVIGVANDQSIAYGCAKAFRTVGADVAITWLNERARPYVEPLANELNASIASVRSGASWTSWCTRSPLRRRTTCKADC
jgi:enoyl-[acyl-carrier-protein] reductase (NADH)